jgi:hypothetical protein
MPKFESGQSEAAKSGLIFPSILLDIEPKGKHCRTISISKGILRLMTLKLIQCLSINAAIACGSVFSRPQHARYDL